MWLIAVRGPLSRGNIRLTDVLCRRRSPAEGGCQGGDDNINREAGR